MIPHPNLLMVFTQQLSAENVTIFRDDPDQTVHIFGMIPNKFRQLLHLAFQPL
jgi:hypothetical protein